MTFCLHLEQDTGFYGCLARERPDKVENIIAKNEMEARHIALDKLYKSSKKYIYASVFNNNSDMIIHIVRC